MKYLSSILINFILVLNLYSKDFNDYTFNWYPRIIVEDDLIVFPDSSKYETYNTTGVWEDNLGNYGLMKCLVSQFINGNKEITLDGYCEANDHKKGKFWMSLKRQSFNKAGVGRSKYIFTDTKYKTLQEKECPYAAQLIEGGGVFKLKCKLSKDEYTILSKQNDLYELNKN
tara:strand:+ start:51 stop:563 length:513 start_codon:yes stop_codon:yes gene_type:complete